ncbi:MAG: ORF6N domain-containing protein [Bacteroidota bacterium]|nr:ORF6N domain-containing protein [Bacteroidota bacterium]
MELLIIQNKIFEVRGLRVMLDFDLAEMYEVKTKVLKQAVKRNISRFPPDFMFELTTQEWDELVTICDHLPETLKYSYVNPTVFTEQGVAMLSSVLRSEKAIEVNIQIIRAFVLLRQYALGYAELNRKLEEFMVETNMQFNDIYQALTELASKKELENKPRNPVGYIRKA